MTEADTKACPYCAETIKAAAIVCKHCGRDLQVRPKAEPLGVWDGAPVMAAPVARRGRWWVWPVGAVGLFLLVALLYTPGPEEEAKRRARAAIKLCWESQERKSLDPEAARFVAGACEEMERKFRDQHGVDP